MLNITDYPSAKKVFEFFEEICKIPHGSENTDGITKYLVDFARSRGLSYFCDEANNVIIKKPATAGYEDRPAIVFQGHTDMVADKTPECEIDMMREGLDIYRDGDFIRARGTTLGGDDGVAIAYALAVLDSNDIPHPDFEALFTSDEEIGLIGATALDTSKLSGRLMVNIDSDGEGIFTVGCAGGIRMDAVRSFAGEESKPIMKLSVSGLLGGHSGVEIDKGRINAIKEIASILGECDAVQISKIKGGNADNAIPRDAFATFYAPTDFHAELTERIIPKKLAEYRKTEPDANIVFESLGCREKVLSTEDSKCILSFTNSLVSGVIAMSSEIEGLVETSMNLGIIDVSSEKAALCASVRSSLEEKKNEVRADVKALASKFGFSVGERGDYPAWEYKKDSYLREVMRDVYKDTYGKDPEIITIHAGLECGIFSSKMPNLDCVSIGPDNFDIHTPEERLSISSTVRVWEYLKALLARI